MRESNFVPQNLENDQKKENIWNLPNLLTLFRIIFAFVAAYFIFAGFDIVYIVVAFIIGMLTDFFDGLVARTFNLKTEFGRQFDMIADRILIVGVALAFIIKFNMLGILTGSHYFQIIFMLLREILTTPIALVTMSIGAGIPQVRFIGKATTVMQSVTFPAILLSIFYEIFSFSLYFAIATGIIGFIASIYYIYDMKNLMTKTTKQQKQ